LQMDTNKIVPDQNSMEEQKIQARAQMLAQQMLQQMANQMQPQQVVAAPQEALPGGMPAEGTAVPQQVPQMADGGMVPNTAEQVLRSLANTNLMQ